MREIQKVPVVPDKAFLLPALPPIACHAPSTLLPRSLQGTERLGDDLLCKMESNLSLFQQFCSTTIFSVPVNAMLTSRVSQSGGEGDYMLLRG